MVGLADLIAGAAHSYRGENVAAVKSYRKCLERRSVEDKSVATSVTGQENRPLDQHVSAFALYELGSILCSTSVSSTIINA